jgi:hypothetical protein
MVKMDQEVQDQVEHLDQVVLAGSSGSARSGETANGSGSAGSRNIWQMNHQEVQVKRNICANGSSGSGNGTSAQNGSSEAGLGGTSGNGSGKAIMVQMDHQEVQESSGASGTSGANGSSGSAGPAEHLSGSKDHRSVAEHLVQMDHQKVQVRAGHLCKWIIRKCRTAVRSSEVQVRRCSSDRGTSGADQAEVQESWWKWTSEVQDQVEHLIEGSNGSSGSKAEHLRKWIIRKPDQVANGSSGRAENGSSGSAGLAEQ